MGLLYLGQLNSKLIDTQPAVALRGRDSNRVFLYQSFSSPETGRVELPAIKALQADKDAALTAQGCAAATYAFN
jgi:hypothetical protein